MSANKNSVQNESWKKKAKGKRKVISPIQTDIARYSDHHIDHSVHDIPCGQLNGQLCNTQAQAEVSQNTKRFHSASYEQFLSEKSTFDNQVMYQQPQFSTPFNSNMQSPPYTQQFCYPGASAGTGPPPPTPPWVSAIMEDMKIIKQSVAKLDSIEKLMSKLNLKVDELETKVKTIDTRLNEVENLNQIVSNEFEDTKETIKSTHWDLKRINTKCKEFDEIVKKLNPIARL